jgi:hypothetical protein
MGTVGIPMVSTSASSAPGSMQMPPSLKSLKGMMTPSAVGNGGKVRKDPSAELTKSAEDGSGTKWGEIGSSGILKEGFKEGFESDARHKLYICNACDGK